MFNWQFKRKLEIALKELDGAEWTDGRYAKVLELLGKYAQAYAVQIQVIYKEYSLIPITTWTAPDFRPRHYATVSAQINRSGVTVGFIELQKKQKNLQKPVIFPKQVINLVSEIASQLGDGKKPGISITCPTLP